MPRVLAAAGFPRRVPRRARSCGRPPAEAPRRPHSGSRIVDRARRLRAWPLAVARSRREDTGRKSTEAEVAIRRPATGRNRSPQPPRTGWAQMTAPSRWTGLLLERRESPATGGTAAGALPETSAHRVACCCMPRATPWRPRAMRAKYRGTLSHGEAHWYANPAPLSSTPERPEKESVRAAFFPLAPGSPNSFEATAAKLREEVRGVRTECVGEMDHTHAFRS